VTSRSALTRLATCQGWRLIAGPLLVAAALLAWASVAMAEGYPSRRITLIVPVAPGGPVDLAARVIANEASTLLGQPITVDNRPGASQKIGMQAVMRAPKDGYTFGAVSPASMSINPLIDPSIGYDPLKDFTLLSQSVGYVMVVLVRPSLAVKSLEELVAYARARPNKLTFGSGGNGTAIHLATEELLMRLDVTAVHVPYKSDAPALNDLLGGQIDLLLAAVAPAKPFVDAGRVVALATTGAQRAPQLPGLLTLSETGLPNLRNYSYRAWVGFVAPSGVPAEVARTLEQALVKAVRSPEVSATLVTDGYEVLGSTAEEFSRELQSELARNRQVIEHSGIKLN